MENLISTENQRNLIKERIEIELLKRGFQVNILSFVVLESKNKFEFISSNFQTTPVLFEKLNISNFSSYIIQKEGGFGFYIQVNVNYRLFTGGNNGFSLFSISGILIENDIFNIQIS